MTRLALLLAVLLASAASSTPLRISGCDGADDQSTNTDSVEFTACADVPTCATPPCTPSACTAPTDSEINLDSSVQHNSSNGGDSSSHWSVKSSASATTGAYYKWASNITDKNGSGYNDLGHGWSVYMTAWPASGKTAPLVGTLEDDGSIGCAFVVDSSKQLTMAYLGAPVTTTSTTCPAAACAADEICLTGTAGNNGQCYKSFGTIASPTMVSNACNNSVTTPCSADSDCPAPNSGTCDGTTQMWHGLEPIQRLGGDTAVSCEAYWNGNLMLSTNVKTVPKTVRPVVSGWCGKPKLFTNQSGAHTAWCDDWAADDLTGSDPRPGWGFVATQVPGATDAPKSWVRTGTDTCSDANHHNCVNDWGNSAVNSYRYDSNAQYLRTSTSSKTETLRTWIPDGVTSGTAVAVPSGASVTAWELIFAGNTDASNGNRNLTLGLTFPSGSTDVTKTIRGCSNATSQTCSQDSDCPTGGSCSTPLVITAGGQATALQLWNRYLFTTSPVSGATSLVSYVNSASRKLVMTSGSTNDSALRVGAVALYQRIRRADPSGLPTIPDRNGDGMRVTVFASDSLGKGVNQATCDSTDPAYEGKACTQPTHASWSSFTNGGNESQPPGGCAYGNDAEVQTCKLHRAEIRNGFGWPCTQNGGECTAWTCDVSGYCKDPDGAIYTSIPCTTNANCDLGDGDGVTESSDCDYQATCDYSCGPPPATCPNLSPGWISPLASRIKVDQLVGCSTDGETLAGAYSTGKLQALCGPTQAHSSCRFYVGTGKCECSSSADCGGNTCSGGVCQAGDPYSVCKAASDCASGKSCQHGRPDVCGFVYLANDIRKVFPSVRDKVSTGFLQYFLIAHDPECSHAVSLRSASSNQPIAGCPGFGAGTYQKTARGCVSDTECRANVGPSSVCGGWSLATSEDYGCVSAVSGNESATKCSISAAVCDPNATTQGGGTLGCSVSEGRASGTAEGGPTCVGYSTTAAHPNDGLCRCSSDGDCVAGYKCAGDNDGTKLCRLACPGGNNDCNTSRSSACVHVADGSSCSGGASDCVCQGRCTVPCDAIPCSSDADCGDGTLTPQASTAPLEPSGICNPAIGKCAACGPTLCGSQTELTGPCSCASNGDCPGGTCDTTTGRCLSGSRTTCENDSGCAANQRCLRPSKQWARWHIYRRTAGDVATKMQSFVDTTYGASTAPILMWGGVPLPGGPTRAGVLNYPAHQCNAGWGFLSLFWDIDFLAMVPDLYKQAGVPERHIVRLDAWNAARFTGTTTAAYHEDAIHCASPGCSAMADPWGTRLNALAVCLQSDGVTPQKYCMTSANTFTSTTCTSNAGCSAGQTCQRRPCVCSTDADCPGGTCSGVGGVCSTCTAGDCCPNASDSCGAS